MGAGGAAGGKCGKDVSAAWSEGSVSPQCCLPLLLLLPSADVVYNAALAGSSAAAFSAVDAPLLYWLLTLLAAAAVQARGEMCRFLFLFLSPPPP